MNHALTITKLHPPGKRPHMIARPFLLERLRTGKGTKLTLVSAPAGFGKTTLLTEWLRAQGEGVFAWVSLDKTDNDLARFLSYLAGAIQSTDRSLGEEILAPLRTQSSSPVQVPIGALINALARLPQDITVVLDDYHEIHEPAIHKAVSYLLEHQPASVRLVISSRTDPPLPLAKLRVRGQLAELRAADLRFSPDEAAAFLQQTMGLRVTKDEVAALGEITEGWVAALQLAALSIRDHTDVSGFVQDFSGNNRHVLDFLAAEVLGQQPADVRDFLLHTSILGRLTAPLCDALTCETGGQKVLERLERDNLFVIPLDDERRWYRYHHLFAEFLVGRLKREHPERLGTLHGRAADWFEAYGFVTEAVEHALAAPSSGSDYERAARLVHNGVEYAWRRGEVPTVLRWLGTLPVKVKRTYPSLLLEHAQALALTGRSNEAERLLAEAESAAQASSGLSPALLGFAAAIRSWNARLRGDALQAVALARRSLSLLPLEEEYLRNFAAGCLGDALWISGDLTAASDAFAEAAEIGRVAGHGYGTLTALALHARVQVERGCLHKAEEALCQVRQFVVEQGVELLPAVGAVHMGNGALCYERNDLEGAAYELRKGVELAEQAGEISILIWGYIILSRLKETQGDALGALALAHKAEGVASDAGAAMELALATAWTARLNIARGDVEIVTASAKVRAEYAGVPWLASLVLARLYLAQGRHSEALGVLKSLQKDAEEEGRMGQVIEALTLQALTYWAKHEREAALKVISRALELAETEGYVRTFVDEGAEVHTILVKLLEVRQRGHPEATRVSPRYLAKLLAAFRPANKEPCANDKLPKPLTKRELEVLALIAAGKSNKEIAATLSVSTGTIKTHINNLNGKLETHTRTQALARAKHLHLI